MKKYFVIFFAAIVCCISLTACTFNLHSKVLDNMSDCRHNLYIAENSEAYINFQSGLREEPFDYDGISQTKVEFGIVTVNFKNKRSDEKIQYSLKVNDNTFQGFLERNPIDGSYMVDIEKKINSGDTLILNFLNNSITLTEKAFEINYEKAIELASLALEQKISRYANSSSFKGECYLTIYDNRKNGFTDYFWNFKVIGQDGTSCSCMLSTTTGEVLVIN